jgi:hypothetical protein
MDLDKFAAIARASEWLEEPLGFSMDVDHAVYTESEAFKMMTPGRAQSREAMVFELEWLGQDEVTVGGEGHGHRATFRITGERTARVVARYDQIMRENFGQQPPRG